MRLEDTQTIVILGRQPALGLAELESLYGADSILPFSKDAALLSVDTDQIAFSRLGGSMRLGKVLAKLPSNNWKDIETYLVRTAPQHAEHVSGKLSFGISAFGVKARDRDVARTALAMKKAIKQSGKSVRMVPHKDMTLGSAVVLYNKLTRDDNWELLVVSDGTSAYLAQTANIQDIDAYAARDQARPARDAKVGMLPPKLAQILVNLATGKVEGQKSKVKSQEDLPQEPKHILDPFCGTGVLIQEALLMGMTTYGTDIEPRMIEYTKKNIEWLYDTFEHTGTSLRIYEADATSHKWDDAHMLDAVAAETFLGKPLSALPPSDQLSKIMQEANTVNHRFLMNISRQLKSGTRLALGVPTWRGKHEFLHLSLLDHLTDMGYTRVRFEHVSNDDLIYHRDGQVVGRELLVLEKN